MKLSKHFVFTLLILTLAGAAQTAFAQKGKPVKKKINAPRTVTDFYKILPAKYFPFFDRVKNRLDLIEGGNDKTGYLNFVGNRAGMPLDNEMLLLKRMSGVPLLVIAYTDCFSVVDGCEAVLHLLEYENGRWSAADAAPPLELQAMREIYQHKTGRAAEEKPHVIYSLSPTDQSLTVKFGGETEVEIYRLEWDDNIYDFGAPK